VNTHEQIAAEKAGIIKPGVPVITAAEPGRGLEVIAKVAHENDSLLTVIDRNDARGALLDAAKIPLVGEHQRLNGAVAVATVRAVEAKIPDVPRSDPERSFDRVLARANAARHERLPASRVLLDGAHNIPGAQALAAAFRGRFRAGAADDDSRRARRQGLARDRRVARAAGGASSSSCRSAASARWLRRSSLRRAALRSPSAAVEVCDSLAQALQLSARDPFLLITGFALPDRRSDGASATAARSALRRARAERVDRAALNLCSAGSNHLGFVARSCWLALGNADEFTSV
jgi:hypothetical protein